MKVSLVVVIVVVIGLCGSQRTSLDTTFLDPLISVRKLFTNIELSSPRVTRTYKYNLENKVPVLLLLFFCGSNFVFSFRNSNRKYRKKNRFCAI